jgi:hypothetical protein
MRWHIQINSTGSIGHLQPVGKGGVSWNKLSKQTTSTGNIIMANNAPAAWVPPLHMDWPALPVLHVAPVAIPDAYPDLAAWAFAVGIVPVLSDDEDTGSESGSPLQQWLPPTYK